MDAGERAEAAEAAPKASETEFKAPLPRKPAAPPPRFGDAPQQQPEAAAGVAGPAPAAAAVTTGSPGDAKADGTQDSQPGGSRPAAPMPPPKFTAPAPRPAGAANAAKAAAVAAARAAQHATPAQRERLVMEAVANAIGFKQAQQEREEEAAAAAARQQEAAAAAAERGEEAPHAAAPPPPGAYEPPDWGGVPEGIPYTLEVMKGGAMLGTLQLGSQGHYTFGRVPTNDVVLDHPSSSRLHAVVQFRGRDGAAFVLDPGSVHGVHLNKQRIPAGEHVPLRVGDMLRFGESSRTYILGGPADLMPQEGPSREDKMKQAALRALAARREREEQVGKAQMEVALSGGASWGFGEDAIDEDADLEEVDWRAYAATRGLSDKQQKVADRIRKGELRIQNLQREIEKIKAKEAHADELTSGQASVLVRNEQEIDRSMAELEELEDQLADSIRDAVGQRKKAAEKAGGGKKKKRRRDSDDEYDGSSDDDAFYDRTARGGAGGAGGGIKGKSGGAAVKQEVEDAASLCGKKEALQEERQRLLLQLQQEEAAAAALAASGGAAADAASTAPAAAAASTGEGGGKGGSAAAAAAARQDQTDSLDAFMSDVAVQLESDKVAAVRKELADVDAQLARTERLLKIADPEGYFKAGSKAVAAAAERAKKQLLLEKQRREAEERQRQQREAEQQRQQQQFVPEEEEEEDEEGGQLRQQRQQAAAAAARGADAAVAAKAAASVHQLAGEDEQAGGLQVRQRPPAAAAAGGQGAPQQQAAPAAGQQQEESNFEKRRKVIAAALAEQKARSGGSGAAGGGRGGGGGNQDAAAKVMADLALLSRARQGAAAAEDYDDAEQQEKQRRKWEARRQKQQKQQEQQGAGQEGPDAEGWQPPQGQSGDGRSNLNDRMGY